MTACVQFVGNQGGKEVLSFYLGMANVLEQASDADLQAVFTTWHRADKAWLDSRGVPARCIACFEDFVAARPAFDIEAEADYLNQAYPEISWSIVVAAERSFTDYSMLLGTAGNRPESREYIIQLLGNLVRFFEQAYTTHPTLAVVTQTPDTLISFVAIRVAQQRRLPLRSIVPAWLLEEGAEGGYFAVDEFMHCRAMHERYAELCHAELSTAEQQRAEAFQQAICRFDGSTSFYKANGRGGDKVLSPHLKHLGSYLKENRELDKNSAYTRFSLMHKIRANLIRLWRRHRARHLLGSSDVTLIPQKSVFYAMHMQPEQSTLAQGIWYVNQIALIENISKSLPVGYVLILKEHNINRGFRPTWQYQHLRQLYNVQFCDAPSKAIAQRVEATIVITGTIGMESLVLHKPVIMLGCSYYDFYKLLYRPAGIEQLPAMLRTILVDKTYPKEAMLHKALMPFLIAYLEALVPAFPMPKNAPLWGQSLLDELSASGLLRPPPTDQL